VTRSTKALIPVLIAVAAIAAYWFMVLSPKREEISGLDKKITQQESAAQQAEQQAASYQGAKDNYRENYTMVARLGKAVPADDDVRSLLIQLDSTAKASKVQFRALTVSGSGGSATSETASTGGDLAPAPGAVSVGSAGFSAMPFSFTFSGTFFRLSDFFSRLERFVSVQNDNIDVTGRLLLVGSIAVTPDGGNFDKLQAEVGASTYIVPPTEGVTAGASPAGPATAAEQVGGSTSTPSATITGVR
jgi:hypothetical protein